MAPVFDNACRCALETKGIIHLEDGETLMTISFPKRNFLPVVLAALLLLLSVSVTSLNAQDDWPRWRGPTGNGIAAEGQTPPVKWGNDQNIVWKSKVPGRGHSSPIVVGDKIFLTTANPSAETQSVLCYSRKDGSKLWETLINQGGLPGRIHGKNTHASPTIATDGSTVMAVFNHNNKTEVVALSDTGSIRWRKDVGAYKPKYPFGFGASPIIYKSLVLVTNENLSNGTVSAFKISNGDLAWKIDRGTITSYSTPVIAKLGGKDQLLLSGGQSVKSYDPETQKENWSAAARWIVSCGTMVWDGDLVFASGGFPAQQTLAVNHKTGRIVWNNSVKAYEQSLLAHDGYVYAHADNGGLYCWRASDGKQMWKQRFKTPESISPTLANGNIYFTAENGSTVVIKCTPDGYQEVARNQLGTSAFASPAFCGNQIFARVGQQGQEYLICIGKP